MINIVKADLIKYANNILDDKILREVKEVIIEIHSNKGETFTYKFETIEEASKFLENFDNDFDETQFVSIFSIWHNDVKTFSGSALSS